MATVQFSVESVTFYDLGENGAMGTANPVKISPIAEDSVSLSIPEATTNDIKAEDISGIVASLPTEPDASTWNFQSMDFSNASLKNYFGGAIEEATKTYSYPATGAPVIQKSFELITKPYKGVKYKYMVPVMQVTASGDIQFVKTDVSKISAKGKILTPFDAAGLPLSPWKRQEIAVV